MIAAFSGLRTTELFNLSWGHVGYRPIELDDGKPFEAIILQVRGKGKEREMAAQPETLTFFNSQRMIFQLQAEREPRDGDPVFFNHYGVRIRRIGKGLTELLKAAELRNSPDGRLRDSRSFRHFYITQQLREGVGHHILGRNTGTSIKMLDEVYSHVQPTDQIKQLIPDWLKRRPLI
jgi:integrase